MPGANLNDKKHGLVGAMRWVPVTSKPCSFARKGVIVHGGPLRVLDVCISKACVRHHPSTKSTAGGASGAKELARTEQLASERAHQAALWKHESEMRKWSVGCFQAIAHEVVRLAVEHVPTDEAPAPAFGRLILSALLGQANYDAVAKYFGVAFKDGTETADDVALIPDEKVATAIVVCLATDAIGYVYGYGKYASELASAAAFLGTLGVQEPADVIQAAARAFEAATPKPTKPRKPSATKAKSATQRKAEQVAKAAKKPTPASVLGKVSAPKPKKKAGAEKAKAS